MAERLVLEHREQLARLVDGTRIAWRRGRWSAPAGRDVAFRTLPGDGP